MERINFIKIEKRKNYEDPAPAWGIDENASEDRSKIFIRCGQCKQCINLSKEHKVDDEGNVWNSIYHDDPRCGWHIWGRLLDWDIKEVSDG